MITLIDLICVYMCIYIYTYSGGGAPADAPELQEAGANQRDPDPETIYFRIYCSTIMLNTKNKP